MPWLNTQLARGSDVFTLKETACGCARTFGHQLGFQLSWKLTVEMVKRAGASELGLLEITNVMPRLRG